LGDQRPGADQLPANPTPGERRDALHDRLGSEGRQEAQQDRQQTRGDRQETRGQNRDDRQQPRTDRQENRQENRGDRQQNREQDRGERQGNREQARDDRLQNREDVRQDWQDHRDQIRNDWQEHRDEARGDWQNWFDDHYGRYGGWYSGYAPGYWGQWDHLWDNYPVAAAAGLTWWGANTLGYQFGYLDYVNPYYVESMPAYYSEPIVTVPIEITQEATGGAAAGGTTLPPGVTSEGVSKFDQARAAFLGGRYDEALKLTDAAIAQMPRDAVLHEFRSLVLFALQRYAEAAATIHPVLDVGPGWDWKTLSGLYPSTDVYTSQLRALETAREKSPKSADLRFLLGYHYLACGYLDQAVSEFQRTVELQPKDPVARSLLATLAPRDLEAAQAPPQDAAKAVPADSVIANWSGESSGKAKYSMNLRKDGTFTWGFTQGTRKQEVKGVYTVEGNVLAMEPDTGGVLLAELSAKAPDTLHFKMINGSPDEPGLEFRRGPST
jgi:tetratricopeptide (TPR) repeat protein